MQSFLISNTANMTPEQKRAAFADQLSQRIMGQQATTPEQGIGQLATALSMGLSSYGQQPGAGGANSPAQSAGATPGQPLGFLNRFGNLFSFGNGAA